MMPRLAAEERRVHTRLLKLALGIEEARAYWQNAQPALPAARQAVQAFEQRWFGARSLRRVRVLLTDLRARYDAFPDALTVLGAWPAMDPAIRQVICHWHLQLADPLYRSFSAGFLPSRRRTAGSFDRDVVSRWVSSTFPDRWGPATVIQFASKLLSAASEAGLITPRRDPRTPLLPKIPAHALSYLLYLLRSTTFSGTLVRNPYLVSVGLEGTFLEQQLLSAPGIRFRRAVDLADIDWQHRSLTSWAEATL